MMRRELFPCAKFLRTLWLYLVMVKVRLLVPGVAISISDETRGRDGGDSGELLDMGIDILTH